MTEQGLANWRALEASKLYGTFRARGTLVETELVEPTLLRHARIPFVSYPYEWPFSMLKDAALLHLELMLAALDEGLTLKDASPYNVQWRGAQPVFIDIGSFEQLQEGEPWAGYRQFCMLMLYPLLLHAHRGVPFQPWLRGSIDGITPEQCRNLLSARDLVRRGVFSHVWLHARLERRYADRRRDVRRELAAAGFRTELIRANVRRLLKLVGSLEWRPRRSEWSAYTTPHPGDADAKTAFVREVTGTRQRRLVWDLGCNEGSYARLAAARGAYVVALDADHAVLDRLYRQLRDERETSILPLLVDVVDPSPSLGWRGAERKALDERGKPELTLCLALLHHVVISRNVPLGEFLDWLRSLGTSVVLEFVDREDPLARRLLATKRAGAHADYDRASFELALRDRFSIERAQQLPSGTRTLYFAHAR